MQCSKPLRSETPASSRFLDTPYYYIVVMSLVPYSDSDSESSNSTLTAKRPARSRESTPVSKKRRIQGSSSNQECANSESNLPPLPAKFRDLYAVATRVSTQDDPDLHGGRKRAIPHVVGNWPTHVYLECKSTISLNILDTKFWGFA